MADYFDAAIAFGHVFLSLWIALCLQTVDDVERVGKLICSWFAIFYSRYGTSKLKGKNDLDCMHYTAMYYWFAILFRCLWQRAYWLHSENSTRIWLVNFHLSIVSIMWNYIMSLDYDEHNAKMLWSNSEIVDGGRGVIIFMLSFLLITYILLLQQLHVAVFFLWTFVIVDAVSIKGPAKYSIVFYE